jgi:hypothetical protein
METFKELLAELLSLKTNGPKNINVGICHNIKYSKETEELLKSIMIQWPKYSGRVTYPVPDPENRSPFFPYHETHNLWEWESKYNCLRWELLDFCIEYLSHESKHS